MRYGLDYMSRSYLLAYLSAKKKEVDMRKFGPKDAEHPSVGNECPACKVPFKAGDFTTLIALGPGDDPEEQEKARTGRPYNAVALEVHWECSTQEEE